MLIAALTNPTSLSFLHPSFRVSSSAPIAFPDFALEVARVKFRSGGVNGGGGDAPQSTALPWLISECVGAFGRQYPVIFAYLGRG
jgi:hypothetical protein